MIRIVNDGKLSCPTFFCDWCEQPIEDAGRALYMWDMEKEIEGERPEPYIAHKRCHRDIEERWIDGTLGTMELQVLPFFLLANSGIEGREAHEKALRLSAMMGMI